MKFAQILQDNATPEWLSAYVDYRRLKKHLKVLRAKMSILYQAKLQRDRRVAENAGEAVTAAPPAQTLPAATAPSKLSFQQSLDMESVGATLGPRIMSKMDEEFFGEVREEAKKVAAFYDGEVAKIRLRLAHLQRACTSPRLAHDQRFRRRFQRSCLELQRWITMVENFAILNFSACSKALKKYAKYVNPAAASFSIPAFVREDLRMYEFARHDAVAVFSMELRKMFAVVFTAGNLRKAADQLRVSHRTLDPLGRTAECADALFRAGMWTGLAVALLALLIFDFIYDYPWNHQPSVVPWAFNIYRGFGFVVLLLLLNAVNTYIFIESRVNYPFIMGLNPRHHLHVRQYFDGATFVCVVFLACFVLFERTVTNEVVSVTSSYGITSQVFPVPGFPSFVYPVILVGALAFLFFAPIPGFFYWSGRKWVLVVLGRMLRAPFCTVHFSDFYFADQMNSLVYFLADTQYLTCFVSRPSNSGEVSFCAGSGTTPLYVISAVPALTRMLQCLRRYRDSGWEAVHAVNMLKYALNVALVVIALSDALTTPDEKAFTVLRGFWISLYGVYTAYAVFWDMVRDWSLFSRKPGQYLYYRWFYVFAPVTNLLARLLWVGTFILRFSGSSLLSSWIVILGSAEVFRRFQWNLLRVENEHLTNVGRYRATLEIPVLVDESDEAGPLAVPPLPGALPLPESTSVVPRSVVGQSRSVAPSGAVSQAELQAGATTTIPAAVEGGGRVPVRRRWFSVDQRPAAERTTALSPEERQARVPARSGNRRPADGAGLSAVAVVLGTAPVHSDRAVIDGAFATDRLDGGPVQDIYPSDDDGWFDGDPATRMV